MTTTLDHYQLVNTSTESTNRIHSDEGAREYGFAGGLVPGSAVLAYVCESLRAALGAPWLEQGYTKVRFAKPMYDGETLDVTLGLDDQAAGLGGTIQATNPRGQLSVTGVFGIGDAGLYAGSRPQLDVQAPPETLPPMVGASLVETDTLASAELEVDAETMSAYLSALGIDPSPYIEAGLASLAYLTRTYLLLYGNNFRRVGPGVHAGTEVQVLRPVRLGERLSVRGRIDRLFRRGGQGYLCMEMAWYGADEVPALWALHSAVFDVKRRGV